MYLQFVRYKTKNLECYVYNNYVFIKNLKRNSHFLTYNNLVITIFCF